MKRQKHPPPQPQPCHANKARLTHSSSLSLLGWFPHVLKQACKMAAVGLSSPLPLSRRLSPLNTGLTWQLRKEMHGTRTTTRAFNRATKEEGFSHPFPLHFHGLLVHLHYKTRQLLLKMEQSYASQAMSVLGPLCHYRYIRILHQQSLLM